MFLTRGQRIVTGFFLAWWYGFLFIIVLAVIIGWPVVILVIFWTAYGSTSVVSRSSGPRR